MSGAQAIENMQAFVVAFQGGDLARARSYWSEDATLHMSGNNRLAGDYVGTDRMLKVMAEVNAAASGFRYEPIDILANDDYLAMIMRFTGEHDGEQVDMRVAIADRVDENGKFAEGWYLPEDQDAFDRILGR